MRCVFHRRTPARASSTDDILGDLHPASRSSPFRRRQASHCGWSQADGNICDGWPGLCMQSHCLLPSAPCPRCNAALFLKPKLLHRCMGRPQAQTSLTDQTSKGKNVLVGLGAEGVGPNVLKNAPRRFASIPGFPLVTIIVNAACPQLSATWTSGHIDSQNNTASSASWLKGVMC